MHIADFDVGMLGANGIVGAGLPIAAGAALAAQLETGDGVAVAFFGDGATGAGPFHESLNISSLWKLPVVWVCENNLYAVDTPIAVGSSQADIAAFASSYNIPGVIVDGNDVFAVYEATRAAVQRARAGEGPSLLECKTFRRNAHALREAPGPDRRPAALLAEWGARDPIAALERFLADGELLAPAEAAQIRESVERALAEAVAFAEASPFPAPEEALEDVFAR
jgi:pyruvate dehydrogenase E1 component alpha subunit